VLAYLIRRLGQSLVVVVGVTLVVFILIRLTGDPVLLLMPSEASAEQVAALRRQLGLDQPLWLQYVQFVLNAAHGDFGTSFRNQQPALGLVLERVPATLQLAAVAFLFTVLIALPVGIISATHRDTWLDGLGRALALLGQAVPTFWLGMMLILVFSVNLRWFPPFGAGGPQHLVLPGLALGAYSAAITSRLLRSSLLEVFGTDYLRTARAKGLSERAVVLGHALQNASLPVVTMLGLQVGTLLGGAVVTEFVFAYPGMGRLVLQSIGNRDYAVVQAFVVLIALIIAGLNILVDLLYAALDPRVRLQ
jgi:peptide/nickel transport system permease protein